MKNFVDIARPLLDTLSEDRGPAEILTPISTPIGYIGFDGKAVPLNGRPEDWDLGVVDEVTEENRRAAVDVAEELGIDVLAFYKSFRFEDHAPFRGQWGIFLINAGIGALAGELKGYKPYLKLTELVKIAAGALYQHERYHFWIDAWALAQECIPLSDRVKRYEYYLARKPMLALTDDDIEESLANRFALGQFRNNFLSDGSRAYPLLRRFFLRCPSPYCRFDFAGKALRASEGLLSGSILNGLQSAALDFVLISRQETELPLLWAQSVRPNIREYPLNSAELCPVFLIKDEEYAGRVQPYQGPNRDEFRRFVERYLNGEPQKRTDHEFYRIDNGQKVKFPNPHVNRIKGHEFSNILLKAGMRRADFQKEREATNRWRKHVPRLEAKPPLSN
ncbi:hypothetical protein [Ectothiorhodospira haloalkaliphila]|uniref:hypothetical protein n=1 Tax=Ectothiorhodospira haloalkaliphila TaxID=421628 RepID=UPI00047CEAFA|nr:hypothetical protein [Ectothiorhodospira haloalkaliphila]